MANKWQRILRGDGSDGLMKKGQEVRWGGGDLRIVLGEKSVGLVFGGDGGWSVAWGRRKGRERGGGNFLFLSDLI
jgi:hypothetical protein